MLASHANVTQELFHLLHEFIDALRGNGGQDMTQPNLENNTDMWIMLYCAVVLLVFNWSLRKFVVEPLGRHLLLKYTRDSDNLKKRTSKLAQSVMELVFYGSFTIIGRC